MLTSPNAISIAFGLPPVTTTAALNSTGSLTSLSIGNTRSRWSIKFRGLDLAHPAEIHRDYATPKGRGVLDDW